MKRLYNETVYTVKTEKNIYLVCMTRLKNTNSGNPRYEFRIIPANDIDTSTWRMAIVYRSTGHYCGDRKECEWIVNRYENEWMKGEM